MEKEGQFFIRLLFLILLVPIILFAEIIGLLHGGKVHPAPKGFVLKKIVTADHKEIVLTVSKKRYDRVLVVVPGYLGSAYHLIENQLDFFESLDYDIVGVDLRNHGNSQFSLPVSGGFYERYDIISTIEWVIGRWNQYSLLASSMGAFSSVFALYDLEPRYYPQSIVFESFGVNFRDGIINSFHNVGSLPKLFSRLLAVYIGYRFPQMFARDISEELAEIDVPLLVIHGDRERIYPPNYVQRVLKKKRKFTTQYVIIHGGRHAKLWKFDRYRNIVKSYLEGGYQNVEKSIELVFSTDPLDK